VDPTTTYTASSEDLVCIVTAGMEKKTVEHFILESRNYKDQGKALREKAGAGKMKTDATG